MSKKNPENLSEMRQGNLYLSADDYVMWLAHKWDTPASVPDASLWHLADGGGTWRVIPMPHMWPMKRIFKQ